MRHLLSATALALLLTSPAFAQQEFPAVLVGHAVLPAQSFIDAPADAPADLKNAGKYTEAVPELQRARQNPNVRLKAMNLLGQCFVQKGMFDLAATQFKTATSEMLAMDGLKKEILYQLALVYEKMGKKDEYLECLKQIYEADYGYLDVAARVEGSYAG